MKKENEDVLVNDDSELKTFSLKMEENRDAENKKDVAAIENNTRANHEDTCGMKNGKKGNMPQTSRRIRQAKLSTRQI